MIGLVLTNQSGRTNQSSRFDGPGARDLPRRYSSASKLVRAQPVDQRTSGIVPYGDVGKHPPLEGISTRFLDDGLKALAGRDIRYLGGRIFEISSADGRGRRYLRTVAY